MNIQKSVRHTLRHTPKKGLLDKFKEAMNKPGNKQTQSFISQKSDSFTSHSQLKCGDDMLLSSKSLHKKPLNSSHICDVSKSPSARRSHRRKQVLLAVPVAVAAVGAGMCLYKSGTTSDILPVCHAREYDEDSTHYKPKTRRK